MMNAILSLGKAKTCICCGKLPIALGRFGEVKLSCPSEGIERVEVSKAQNCNGVILPAHRDEWYALQDWNKQQERN